MMRLLAPALLAATVLAALGTHANAQDIRGIAIGASKDTVPASCKPRRKTPYIRDCAFDDGARLAVMAGENTGKIWQLVYVFKKTARLTPDSELGKTLIAKYGQAQVGQIEKLEWPRDNGFMFARCDKRECRLEIYDKTLDQEDKKAAPAKPSGAAPKF